MSKPALSAIICSINPHEFKRIESNLKETAGRSSVEVLGFDNRELKWGICKVYNHLASKAQSDKLLFIHEDVIFKSYGWADEVLEKLDDPSTGVIGFAGSTYKTRAYSGWYIASKPEAMRGNVLSNYKPQSILSEEKQMASKKPFDEVITIDGFAMFVRKNVWSAIKFNEDALPGFHGYDIDFSVSTTHMGFRNYVWFVPDVMHYSNGRHDEHWLEHIINVHDAKLHRMLPLSVNHVKFSDRMMMEAKEDYFFLTRVKNSLLPSDIKIRVWRRFLVKTLYNPFYLMMMSKGLIQSVIGHRHLSR